MPTNSQEAGALTSSIQAVQQAAGLAQDYLQGLLMRRVSAAPEAIAQLAGFDMSLPEHPSDPKRTLDLLHALGSPATTATAGGRFFGLVMGGTLPATLGARVLTSAWDQAVFNDAISPVGVKLEAVATRWLLDLFGLDAACSVGFTTGATMANFTCLSAARHAILARAGWDVETRGMAGAPPLRVIASEQIHVTVLKALSLLGFGTASIERVACDNNGAIRVDALPKLDEHSIILTQAGNVNSGACDPIGEIAQRAAATQSWVHVDGAFGLWAAAGHRTRHLLSGYEKADSWVTDGHKWLNTPYDCGIAICKSPTDVHAAMATQAPYLKLGDIAAPKDMVPEFSRSARGVEIWAALHSLGRSGISELIERCCEHARRLAAGLQEIGFEILNEVVLNQVVATIPGQEAAMPEVARYVQMSGEAWFGPTIWRGRQGIRLSVSSWLTTASDVDRTLKAISKAVQSNSRQPT